MGLTTPPKDSSHTPSSSPHETDRCHLTCFQNLKALSSLALKSFFQLWSNGSLISFKSWYVTEPGFEHKLSDFRAQAMSCWYPLQRIMGLQCLLLSDANDFSAKPTLMAGRFLHFTEEECEWQEGRKSEPKDPRMEETEMEADVLFSLSTYTCSENIPLSFSAQASDLVWHLDESRYRCTC